MATFGMPGISRPGCSTCKNRDNGLLRHAFIASSWRGAQEPVLPINCHRCLPEEREATLALCGFSDEEFESLREALSEDGLRCVLPTAHMMAQPADAVVHARLPEGQEVDEHDIGDFPCRLALLLDDPRSHPSFPSCVSEVLEEVMDGPGAVCGALTPGCTGKTLRQVAEGICESHATIYGLLQPIPTIPGEAVPEAAQLAMHVTLDQSEGGGPGEGKTLVVLDGMLSDDERGDLLDWLTAPGWDHSQEPPEQSWEQNCPDVDGARMAWGLTEDMTMRLQCNPPHPVLLLQSRLAALYPDYVIGFMPCEGLDDSALVPFIGNAVMATDSPSWHEDFCPLQGSPISLWAAQYGFYPNRQAGKPLFVSAILYLNSHWEAAWNAETLFLDAQLGTGLFVSPEPGRLVLMEQDVPHRINVPSPSAPECRYSLVWKLVFFPRTVDTPCTISRPQWGPPVRWGSCAGLPLRAQ